MTPASDDNRLTRAAWSTRRLSSLHPQPSTALGAEPYAELDTVGYVANTKVASLVAAQSSSTASRWLMK